MGKPTLKTFLYEHSRFHDKSLPCTHTSMGAKKGSYSIPDSDLEKFYDLYIKAFYDGCDLGIVERHKDVSPVLIDLDLRQDSEESFIKLCHIKQFVSIVLGILASYVVLPEECICVIQRKPVRKSEKGVYKDGIHIILQNIVTTPDIQFQVRDKVIDQAHGFFHTIYPYQNDIQDIYDASVIKENGWLMCGSKKENEKKAWVIKHVLVYASQDKDFIPIDVHSRFDKCDWVRFISIRNKDHLECPYTPLGMEIKSQSASSQANKKTKKQHKPVSSSSNPEQTRDAPPRELPKDNDAYRALQLRNIINAMQQHLVIKDRVDAYSNTLSFLLHELLDASYADNYHTWIEIGYCLHYLGDAYLSLWKSFSKRSPKYDEKECELAWEKMRTSGNIKTIASLLQMLKEEYAHDQYVFQDVQLTMAKQERQFFQQSDAWIVARYMYHAFPRKFFIRHDMKGIYMEDEHRWKLLHKSDDSLIRTCIINQVYPDISRYTLCLEHKMKCVTSQDEINALSSEFKRFEGIESNLTKVCFTDLVIRSMVPLFHDNFVKRYEKLDENKHFIGFTNGVYDLQTMTFRPGDPDDHITFCTNYPFDAEARPDIQNSILEFVHNITPHREMAEYLLTVLAYMLCGDKYLELFWFFTGSGRNGKGTLLHLLSHTLGDYYIEPDASVINNRIDNSSATPEMAKAKGKRVLCCSEPDDSSTNKKLPANKLKQLRGRDRISVRALYANPIEFVPQFGMIFQMNDMPRLTNADKALAKTIHVVHFPYTFTSHPDTKKNEKPIDMSLKDKFSSVAYRQQFMLLLLTYYDKYVRGRKQLHVPREVVAHSRQYMQDSDILQSWISETLEITQDPRDRVKCADIFLDFKQFAAHDDASKMDPIAFGKRFRSKTGLESIVYNKCRYYKGVKMRTDDEDDAPCLFPTVDDDE